MLRSRSDCGRVRGPMRHVVLIAFSSLLLVTSGCKTQCRLLSEKLCDCTTNSTDKTNCLQSVAARDGTYVATEQSEATCEALAPNCDCRLVDTQAGKERCGMAVSGDAGN
jgi:hypothetical protein